MNLKSVIGRFRLIAILEGISYLLFAVTMPLKYMLDIPQPNYVVGMAHGVLFIAYIFLALQAIFVYKWNIKTAFMILAASLIPTATFFVDSKILKPESEKLNEAL
ncbi:DUF3817 domain-containing protein [Marinigracilibium pacificum]|uniref:DUF3817 domain-containing protein n=1 Tax=Marinigracilibium pacificum TaxID=2729599 RepID=A0A848J2J2_9BACT|nr:DUF3817 domain-containing protein [Marinigracilibium pacificum]NMM50817.1 DUF3817 domain-containing protein [Marinigracilibium pacificum]